MGLSEDLKAEMKENAEFRGEMRQWIKDSGQVIYGIRHKLNGHIDDHVKELNDSIKDNKRAARDRVGMIVALCTSMLAVVLEVVTRWKWP